MLHEALFLMFHKCHLFLHVLTPADNNRVMGQYTDQVEEQHAYIKETVDTVFPSNIRVLQVKHHLKLNHQKCTEK